jgi:hypothetical protein
VRSNRLSNRSLRGGIVVALLFAGTTAIVAQTRVGSTFFPKPADGGTRRFSDIAHDATNNAYLVVWGLGQVGARYVAATGTPLGNPTTLNTVSGGASRVACSTTTGRCLVAWIQEPTSIIGRFVRYNAGAVQFVTAPFVINQVGSKLTSAAPSVAFSSASDEFLVSWTEFSPSPNVKAQRVTESAALAGGPISVAITSLWEGFSSVAYNSAQDEFLVVYYFESSGGTNAVGAQRVKAGTGALIGGRSTLYASTFDQYPEVAYNSDQNQYLAITWGYSGGSWMLRGRLADGNAQPLGASSVPLAVQGGGDGIGLAYNPVSNTYLGVFLSQKNAEIWGVQVNGGGVPGAQAQLTVSGTTLATQPQAAGSSAVGNWMMVASEGYKRVMGQLVSQSAQAAPPPPPATSCTTVQPAAGWTCVNGNWLPPTTGGGSAGGGTTGGCTTVQPAAGWTCVNGNWLPPTTSTGGCTTVKPASNWVCVNGNWLPPTTSSTGGCTTVQPGTGWTCVNGNWLPPTTGSTGGCTTVKPASNWVCVNGNWLPPTSSTGTCTTVQPGAGWTCVNGNWLPPTTSTSSCTTVKPGANWTCVNGNWLPPGY